MKTNETDLIKNSSQRLMTAKGYKLTWKFIDKAALANNTHRMSPDFREKKEKLYSLIDTLVFDKKATYEQLSDLLNKIKIVNNEPICIPTDKPFII